MLNISKKTSFHNFGYLPKGSILRDLYGKLFGNPNLSKRLQAKDIMSVLQLKSDDIALDLGCGNGFITVEIAKSVRKATGIDISPGVKFLKIPPSLSTRLSFVHYDGSSLPFEENHFDIILSSEVIAQVPDKNQFLSEIKRVLKPGGRLILVNGCGHPVIEEAYRDKNKFYRDAIKKYGDRVPESYQKYCSILNKDFDNLEERFLTVKDLDRILSANKYEKISAVCSPGYSYGARWSKNLFLKYLKTGETYRRSPIDYLLFIIKYHYYSWAQSREKEKYKGGVIYEARNNK